jgi:hypothetical protein
MDTFNNEQCPACVDGFHVTPQGEQEVCPVCHGVAAVSPGQFCYCGESVSFEFEKIRYCGDAKCWQQLHKLRST